MRECDYCGHYPNLVRQGNYMCNSCYADYQMGNIIEEKENDYGEDDDCLVNIAEQFEEEVMKMAYCAKCGISLDLYGSYVCDDGSLVCGYCASGMEIDKGRVEQFEQDENKKDEEKSKDIKELAYLLHRTTLLLYKHLHKDSE